MTHPSTCAGWLVVNVSMPSSHASLGYKPPEVNEDAPLPRAVQDVGPIVLTGVMPDPALHG